jgi:hypothetical protein
MVPKLLISGGCIISHYTINSDEDQSLKITIIAPISYEAYFEITKANN